MKYFRFWPVLLLILVVAGALRLRLDLDVLNLLPRELPAVKGLKLYQKNFANARELIITLRASDAEIAESAARSLAEMLRGQGGLAYDAQWQPPWLEHPEEASELIAAIWLNQPPADVRALSKRLEAEPLRSSLASMREQLRAGLSPSELGTLGYDPFGFLKLPESSGTGAESFSPQQGEQIFASAEGTFRVIFVEAPEGITSYRKCAAWVEAVKKAVERWRGTSPASGLKIGYTGGAAFEAEISSGMEKDMTQSVGVTAAIIGILFWLAHRRITPMLWLLLLLGVILGATLAIGGLIFGDINVVSLGFASILLGLAVDYGVVHYQEALAAPRATIPEIRRAIGPSIFWAAITQISAFLMLNFSGMPGLAQLGSLVAVGIVLSAGVMLFAFLPPLFRDRAASRGGGGDVKDEPEIHSQSPVPRRQAALAWSGAAVLLGFVLWELADGFPKMDKSSDALRPRNSAAFAALQEVQKNLARGREPMWIITADKDAGVVGNRLAKAEPILALAESSGMIGGHQLPTALWPNPVNQSSNRTTISEIVHERARLHEAALGSGFTAEALVLTDRIMKSWQDFLVTPGLFWPTNRTSQWILKKVSARREGEYMAVGFVTPNSRSGSSTRWQADIEQSGFWVCSWELLGETVFARVDKNLPMVAAPMIVLVLLALWMAFGRAAEILLSLGVLAMSGLGLLAVMRAAGWTWNLLNLMSLPLILGSGVDYSIFMQLALRRHNGILRAAHNSVGRALLLCGATAMAGFGSLAWSANAGIASLGMVCAIGLAFNMVLSVYVLPVWWRAATKNRSTVKEPNLQREKT